MVREPPGSIPASAGEPDLPFRAGRPGRVYPRECGGTAVRMRIDPDESGLSPRVRGNLREGHRRIAGAGSIPASAGEPGWRLLSRRRTRVYPRECGGTRYGVMMMRYARGLSPRVRGNRGTRRRVSRSLGSIPASAGEPDGGVQRGGYGGVYPRECGGTTDASSSSINGMGLSPRVRGNRIWINSSSTPIVLAPDKTGCAGSDRFGTVAAMTG